ncbi:MAG: hypothetical protein J7M24_04890, partial [Candidatus Latescibacteria bacterium]|nr:hypothetical protein [Candidatus Latescibacterota bacterium]
MRRIAGSSAPGERMVAVMGRAGAVIIAACALLAVAAAGCHNAVELENIRVTSGNDGAVVEAFLSAETGYTLAAEQNGSVLVLSLPGAVRSPKLPKEQLVDRSRFLSGWFTGERGDALEVRFYLTGPLSYTDAGAGGGADSRTAFESTFRIRRKRTPRGGK